MEAIQYENQTVYMQHIFREEDKDTASLIEAVRKVSLWTTPSI